MMMSMMTLMMRSMISKLLMETLQTLKGNIFVVISI
jgi:hypothetical protein